MAGKGIHIHGLQKGTLWLPTRLSSHPPPPILKFISLTDFCRQVMTWDYKMCT